MQDKEDTRLLYLLQAVDYKDFFKLCREELRVGDAAQLMPCR